MQTSLYRLWLTSGIIICLIASIWAAWIKPPFLDEYWTAWFTDPNKAPGKELVRFWLSDTPHPPLFNALAWGFVPLPLDAIPARRLFNLAALLLPISSIFFARRQQGATNWSLLLLLAVLTCPLIVGKFVWHRAYFFDFMAATALIISLRALCQNKRPATSQYVWLGVLALFGINLDYMFAVATLALLGVQAASNWIAGRRKDAIVLVAISVVAAVPLAFTMTLALSIAPAMISYESPFLSGLRSILLVGGIAGMGNVVLLAIAARNGRMGWRAFPPNFAWILLSAIVLITMGFLTLHALKGFLIPRQALGLAVPTVALAVELATRRSLPPIAIKAIVVNAMVLSVVGAAIAVRERSIAHAIPKLQTVLSACTGRELIMVRALDMAPPDSFLRLNTGRSEAIKMLMDNLAYQHRLPLQWAYLRPLQPVGTCGAVVWLEFFWGNVADLSPARLADEARIAVTPGQLETARVVQIGPAGYMVVIDGKKLTDGRK